VNRLQKLIKKYLDQGLSDRQANQLANAVYGKKPVYGLRQSFKIAMKGKK